MAEQVNLLNIPSIQNKKNIVFTGGNHTSMQGVTGASVANPEETTMQGGTRLNTPSVGDTELGNRIKNSSEMGQSPYTFPVTLATWYAIAQGMDKFGQKCGGTYEQSLLGKVTGGADRLSNAVTESKLAKSSFGQFVGRMGKSFKDFLNRVTNNPKNRTLYALRHTPTRPECKFVIAPAAGVDGFLVMDTTKTVFDEFLKPAKKAIQLKQYGKDQAYINNFLNSIKGLSKQEKLLKLQQEELSYFGVKAADIAEKSADDVAKMLRELKITKGLGFKDIAEYERFLDDQYALSHMNDLKDILRRGDQKLKISIWKGDGVLGKIKGHFFGRELGVSELANKFEMLTTGGKTKLGKFTGKAFAYLTEGSTNRFAGGKLAVFMQAFIFADMLIHTFKAPSGEKGKTLAERFVNDFTYFLALPLGIGLMHMAGGLKYIGMTKEQVSSFRESLKHFHDRAKMGDLTKKGFKMRKKVLERQLKGGVKNPFLKLLKKGANLLTIGIERMPTYKSSSTLNLNWLRKSKYFGKNAIGYVLRFAIPMFMLSPMFAKWTTQATHKIFGRPTNSVLDEESSEDPSSEIAATATAAQTSAQTAQKVNSAKNSQDPKTPFGQRNPQDYKSDTNLIKMAMNGQKPTQTTSSTTVSETNNNNKTVTTNTTTTVQTQQTDPNAQPEPVRTYIPSPVGVVLNEPDMSAAEQALARADEVEKQAYEVLKSV